MDYYWEKQNSKTMSLHWQAWIADLIKQHGNAYFLTFMFNNIPGNQETKLNIMKNNIDHFYNRLLRRSLRNPRSLSHIHKRPFLFASPDLPIPKHLKDSYAAVTINDGLHMHGIIIILPGTRIKTGFPFHLYQYQKNYCKYNYIRNIHLVPINRTSEVVADYMTKAIGVHFDDSNIWIWPNARPTEKRRKLIDHYLGEKGEYKLS